MQLTIATFNIHHGEGRDGRNDLSRTAAVIRGLQADLVALQEVDRGFARSGYIDQVEELQRLTDMAIHFWPTMAPESGGEYGIALAARESIDTSFTELPRARLREPRGVVMAEWEGIRVLATHLAKADPDRRLQTERLAQLATPSAVIAGDLNQTRRHLQPLVRAGFETGPPRSTVPPWWLGRQIDYVLVGPDLLLESVRCIPSDVSDHRPLVATIHT
ncbi:MAG TPA: endonuclease/exonuclease/phosphatase family protein [Actinomycetota bacterium]|nr:endonuclease/exonuclease/phosphatase family protein [Actinomycetota bacterium]